MTGPDSPQTDTGADAVVLRLDDPAARLAVLTYAAAIADGNPQLASELRDRVARQPRAAELPATPRALAVPGHYAATAIPADCVPEWQDVTGFVVWKGSQCLGLCYLHPCGEWTYGPPNDCPVLRTVALEVIGAALADAGRIVDALAAMPTLPDGQAAAVILSPDYRADAADLAAAKGGAL